MATIEVAAALLPEHEQTDKLTEETASGGISATTNTNEVIEVEDDEDEEQSQAPEETSPETSSNEKDEEEEATGTKTRNRLEALLKLICCFSVFLSLK